jgi:hypothetical protein
MKNSGKTTIKKKNSASKQRIGGEVKRILKANIKGEECGCEEGYIPFAKSFITFLVKEADEAPVGDAKTPEQFTPDQNQKDFEGSLEQGTDAGRFDTQGTDPAITANAITAVKDWSEKLAEFAKFMNNPDSQSLHKILAAEDRPGSLLRGVTRKASDSITRIAGEIEKLKEVLNGFIIMAPKKERDAEQLKMG